MPEPDLQMPHAPMLVIDTSCTPLFAGILDQDTNWLATEQQDGAALESLFPTVEKVVQDSGIPLESIRSFLYAEGPGSVLGLRLCAMAIETWSRLASEPTSLYAYNSLQLCALTLQMDYPKIRDFLLVSDWKKNAWNAAQCNAGQVGETTAISSDALATSAMPIFHLPQRKGWQAAPPQAQTVTYSPKRISDLLRQPGFLRPTKSVELYNTGVNTFQKWTADRHRSPANQ
ncbi:peptidase M22 [Coraliomargarita akajimensis]|uniref:Peptidase M22 glycoprotease n=1 Tax=Coraliomargarita akajimensis (strain DSM 45221 / IAM 15411 / JCM 23193 / KCTC 12865 / 04OKA010-24) TaxID=583355 RepID=D5EIA8_CORAD|nr:peptidase M22 [Coraliomargarita akajimensis]ADE54174.1 peptidase M22 glycoprotease [Coraliomargarita akajimensis DSM 45221]